jgi:hypothetical protein
MSGINPSDIFNPAPAQQSTPDVNSQTAPPQAGNINNPPVVETKEGGGTDTNGVVPKNNVTDDKSPLAQFDGLWDNDSKENSDEPAPLVQQIDSTKLGEVLSKVDFTKGVEKETLSKVAAGGEEAVGAVNQLLNKVGQQVAAQNVQITQKLIEQAVTATREATLAEIPELVRSASLQDSLATNNPVLNNPALKPIADMVQSQLQLKHPDATVTQLQQLTGEYLSGLADVLAPTKEQDTAKTGASTGAIDWDTWVQQS